MNQEPIPEPVVPGFEPGTATIASKRITIELTGSLSPQTTTSTTSVLNAVTQPIYNPAEMAAVQPPTNPHYPVSTVSDTVQSRAKVSGPTRYFRTVLSSETLGCAASPDLGELSLQWH